MGFNTSGFVVGLLVARQYKLPQSSAVTVGALTSAMGGMNAMGVVMATVMAQRLAPAPAAAASSGTPGGPAPGLHAPNDVKAQVRSEEDDHLIVRVTWDGVRGASGYRVTQVYKQTQRALIATVSTPHVRIASDQLKLSAASDVTAGAYSYEVVAIDDAGVAGTPATVKLTASASVLE